MYFLKMKYNIFLNSLKLNTNYNHVELIDLDENILCIKRNVI